jgi:hypothetical protein
MDRQSSSIANPKKRSRPVNSDRFGLRHPDSCLFTKRHVETVRSQQLTVWGHVTKYGRALGWESCYESRSKFILPDPKPTAHDLFIPVNGGHDMHRFLVVGGLLLSASLIAPVAVRADDDHHRERRYYDREHRDYHVWNDHEDRAYRVYLGERHQ